MADRRRNGDGSLFKRGDGNSPYWIMSYKGHQKSTGLFANKSNLAEAKKLLKDYVININNKLGIVDLKLSDKSIQELYRQFIAIKKRSKTVDTIDRYDLSFHRIFETNDFAIKFRDKILECVDNFLLNPINLKNGKLLSDETIKDYLRDVDVFLAWCFAHEVWVRPLKVGKFFSPNKNPSKMENIGLNRNDVQMILSRVLYTGEPSLSDKEFANFINFLYLTGCRPGEILRLKFDDIDFERQTFEIQNKKRKSIKHCYPLNELRMKIIKEQYLFAQDRSINKNKVFPWIKPDSINKRFRAILEELGLYREHEGLYRRLRKQWIQDTLRAVDGNKARAMNVTRHLNPTQVLRNYDRYEMEDEINLMEKIGR